MRIVCPSCDAEYDVPVSRMKPGKMVRCARCGGEWVASELQGGADHTGSFQPLPDFEAESDAEPLPDLAAMDPHMAAPHLAAPHSPAPSSVGLIAAWVLTLFVLIAALSATITWRKDIVRAWPPSSRILGSPDYPAPPPAPGSGVEHNGK